jgi:hypothetical protein
MTGDGHENFLLPWEKTAQTGALIKRVWMNFLGTLMETPGQFFSKNDGKKPI